MASPTHRHIAVVAFLAGGLALGVALGAEHVFGLAPCALCLVERWPYRVLLLLALVALLLPPRAARWGLVLCGLALAAEAGLGALHFGVEQHWWPSPLPECAAPRFHAFDARSLLAAMPAQPAKPCDAPTYPLPGLPLSLVALNLLYAVSGLAVLLVALFPSPSRSTR
jgi:disulfide bond formation protein DsbB